MNCVIGECSCRHCLIRGCLMVGHLRPLKCCPQSLPACSLGRCVPHYLQSCLIACLPGCLGSDRRASSQRIEGLFRVRISQLVRQIATWQVDMCLADQPDSMHTCKVQLFKSSPWQHEVELIVTFLVMLRILQMWHECADKTRLTCLCIRNSCTMSNIL